MTPSTDRRPQPLGGPGRGRTVLVTGCSSGFGLDTAVELARRGWHVVATMRNLDRRGRLDQAAAAAGVHLDVAALDVCDTDSIARAFKETLVHTGGRLDAVVHNAGIGDAGFFEDVPEEVGRRIMETNFFGVLALTRAVLPTMRAQRHGRLVIISSLSAFVAPPLTSMYAASKRGVEAWAESLAVEVAPFGIDVALVEPGTYKTDIWTGAEFTRVEGSPYLPFADPMDERIRAMVDRFGRDPREVARRVARILAARRPPLRNPVGPDAWGMWAMSRLVPFRVRRRLLARVTGMHRATVEPLPRTR